MIVFRCGAGPRVGIGHVVRCRQLAVLLGRLGRGAVMVGPSRDYAVARDATLFRDWIPVPDWESSEADAARVVAAAGRFGAAALVMDDYRVDEPYQLVLRAAGLRWMQQFDASRPQPFWADFVVNASPYEKREHYAGLLRGERTEVLFGPRYAILRPEFPPETVGEPGRPVTRVLLTFGGGDDHGAIRRVATALAGEPDLRFVAVSGPHNPANEALRAWVRDEAGDRVSLLIDPADVAGTFASCDLAVMGGGTSTYEAAACGLPMLLVAMAENQCRQGQGWEDLGAARFLGRAGELSDAALLAAVRGLRDDAAARAAMSRRGRSLVDGRGGLRLLQHLLGERVS